jgi:uncharacterized membrane protein YdjX (TVP38/TMEM64 family)
VAVLAWAGGPTVDRVWTVALESLESLEDHPLMPLAVVALVVVSACVAMPLSVVVLAVMALLGPLQGAIWSAAGAALSAGLTFAVGRVLSEPLSRLDRVRRARDRLEPMLDRNGVLAVAVARNLPLGPYPVVNLALGALPVRFWSFMVGNLVGLLPWFVLWAAAVAGVEELAVGARGWAATAGAIAAVVLAALLLARRRLR